MSAAADRLKQVAEDCAVFWFESNIFRLLIRGNEEDCKSKVTERWSNYIDHADIGR
jgi:hypothetical protein